MVIHVELGASSYDIELCRGALARAGELINLNRKVMVVTDSGVPAEYADTVRNLAKEGYQVTVPQGEESKCFAMLEHILGVMLDMGFTRKDAVVAVGGGVVGDLAGFAASMYMRGIDFYNIPTTLLSQVDSSIGGKTAVDFHGYKNVIGAFYQPKKVIIDPDVLKTLEKRQVAAGMAEAIKMSLTSDAEMFAMLEEADDIYADIDMVIEKALLIKKHVVECDEKEAGLRKILNFGHTVGHGIESARGGYFYHGECVALGMLPMCSEEVRSRLVPVLKKAGLPTELRLYEDDLREVMTAVSHDKKSAAGGIDAVLVHEAGSFEIKKLTLAEIEEKTKKIFSPR
ncbi:MAG: 3-dehydroquinate synthase [Clostridia bacterium]|nr:3-dehydroquinate synthase [Clostridia bacterium]